MTKWHNGPKGPSVCRAVKGNCPFGGSDSHFDSKEDAQKVFESQSEQTYGLLPGMNSESETKPSVLATNSNGIPLANSNYAQTGQGSEADRKYFESKFNDTSLSAKEIADSLNNDPKISGQWKPLIKTKEKMILRTIDAFGNENKVTVKFENQKAKSNERTEGDMFAYNPKTKIAESTSNFVSTLNFKTGTKGASAHFNNIIKNASFDASKMAKALNKDENVFGKWTVKQENNDVILLQQKDEFGNLSEVNIQKPHVDKPQKDPFISEDKRTTGDAVAHSVQKGINSREYHNLSNFVNINKLGKGTEGAETHISNIFKSHSSNKDTLVETLNKDKNVYGKWSVKKDMDEKVVLECKRPGEDSAFITVTK